MTAANFNSYASGSPTFIPQHDSGQARGFDAVPSEVHRAIDTNHYELIHSTVGRCRLRIPRLAYDRNYACQLQSVLKQIDFVQDVRINDRIASIVITYQQPSSDSISSRLFSAIQMDRLPLMDQSSEPSSSQERISQVLQRFLEQHPGDEIRLRDLLDELGDRAFGPTLIICALPEALPLPIAGISALIAIPLMLVSGQLIFGYHQPWLPDQILDQPLKREHCEQVINAAIPFLQKLECFVEPRWSVLTTPEAERAVGVMLLFLSFIIALPIPFGNMLPAIVIVLICLGLIEKDGLIIAISAILTGITPALLLLVL